MLNPSESKRSKTEKLAEQTGDTEQELWAEVMEEYEKDEELGKEIIPPLRSTAKVMWLKKLDADKLKNKLQATKIPENCKFMKVKQCNKFIWSLAKCRSEDIKVQAIQQSLVKSQVCVLRAAEALSNAAKADDKTPDYREVLSLLRESIGFAGHSNQNLNQYRRELYRASIPTAMHSITKDVPEEDELLFGDDLEKRAQEVQNTSKALAAFKIKTTGYGGGNKGGSKQQYKHGSTYTGGKKPFQNRDNQLQQQQRGKPNQSTSKNVKSSYKTQRRTNRE